MVERLKEALEKARQQRAQVPADISAAPSQAVRVSRRGFEEAWQSLREIVLDPKAMERHRLVMPGRSNPAQTAIDILRTRLMAVCRNNGWRRIGITSPTKGCGKTFVSVNLAFSLSRNREIRTILMDLDLKNPQVSRLLGASPVNPTHALIDGSSAASDVLLRHGPNLAFVIADKPARYSAELIQGEAAGVAVAALSRDYEPDLILFDLPPMFISDDVLGFMTNLDALIIIAAAGQTTAAEITECESLIGTGTNFLGVVLNKVETSDIERYDAKYADLAVSD